MRHDDRRHRPSRTNKAFRPYHAGPAFTVVLLLVTVFSGSAAALDINDTDSLDYWSDTTLDFRIEMDGTIRAQNILDMNGNNVNSINKIQLQNTESASNGQIARDNSIGYLGNWGNNGNAVLWDSYNVQGGNAISISGGKGQESNPQIAVSASGLAGSYLSASGGNLNVNDNWVDENGDGMSGNLNMKTNNINDILYLQGSADPQKQDIGFLNNGDIQFRDATNTNALKIINGTRNVKIPNGDLNLGNNLLWNSEARLTFNGGTSNLNTVDAGDTIKLKDSYNNLDILVAREGGNVEIPNGDLNMNGNQLDNVQDIEMDGDIHGSGVDMSLQEVGSVLGPRNGDTDLNIQTQGGGSHVVSIEDGSSSNQDIARFHEGTQNVEIPNGNLDMNDNDIYMDGSSDPLTESGSLSPQVNPIQGYRFEGNPGTGNVPEGWTANTGDPHIDDTRGYDSSQSMRLGSGGNDAVASIYPEMDGQVTTSWNYWETSSMCRVQMVWFNENGNRILRVGSENPQWEVNDAGGATNIYGSSGYQDWHYVETEIDTQKDNYTLYWTNLETGHKETYSGNLETSADRISRIQAFDACDDEAWVDNVNVMQSGSSTNQFLSVSGSDGVSHQTMTGNLDMGGNSLQNVGGLNGDCPSGYVWVSSSAKFGTMPGFCIMKWEAKNDGSGNPISQASSDPWVSIEQYNAKQKCRSLGDGYHLVSEREWMTMAYQIANNPNNWADGNIGSKASNGGGLFMGNVAPPSSHSHLGYDGPNPDSGTGRDTTARLELENGNYVWDLSGNVWEWTSTRINTLNGGRESPRQNGAAGDKGGHELDEITDWRGLSESRPPRVWDSSQGIGRIYLNGDNTNGPGGEVYDRSAVVRGGHWSDGRSAGLFRLGLDAAASRTRSLYGFRCSKTL